VDFPSPGGDTAGNAEDHASADQVDLVCRWYAANARPLPWRDEQRTAWGVLVSEVMLQQTPVARVEPVWRAWMKRWPQPADLAAAAKADVLRSWQGMGYPRRAARMQEAAALIGTRHGGEVPATMPDLMALPGVGEYTASAVLAFAFGQRTVVLDTNVRRVLSRWRSGIPGPASSSVSRAERATAGHILPAGDQAPLWSVAVMELGALVCTARAPRCGGCPLRPECGWHAAGMPAGPPATRRQPPYEGSHRQARGMVLEAVGAGPCPVAEISERWAARRGCDPAQAAADIGRAVRTLADDGLVAAGAGMVGLP